MKRYIKTNTEKPTLDSVRIDWEEFEDGTGIKFTVFSEDYDVLFEEIFNYDDVDSDLIYDSAIDMAVAALSLNYNLTDNAIRDLQGDVG